MEQLFLHNDRVKSPLHFFWKLVTLQNFRVKGFLLLIIGAGECSKGLVAVNVQFNSVWRSACAFFVSLENPA